MNALNLYVVGLNHRNFPVKIREKLFVPPEKEAAHAAVIQEILGSEQFIFLQTCNRYEIYWSYGSYHKQFEALKKSLAEFHSVDDLTQEDAFYRYSKSEAFRHLGRVVSGLDSQILGEPEIFGQVKDAFRQSNRQRKVGPWLQKVFHLAFRLGKRVRSETRIGEGMNSIPSAAVAALQKELNDFSKKRILIWGVGTIGRSVITCLLGRGGTDVYCTNRTYARALEAAKEFDIQSIPFTEVQQRLKEFDVLVTATASPSVVIDHAFIQESGLDAAEKKYIFVDLGVPRNIDSRLADLQNVRLINIDQIEDVVHENHEIRKSAIPTVNAIINETVAEFDKLVNTQSMESMIRALLRALSLISSLHYEQNKRYFDEKQWAMLDRYTKSLMRKILHEPIETLRSNGHVDDTVQGHLQFIRELFGIESLEQELAASEQMKAPDK